jgi:hypothetical protein
METGEKRRGSGERQTEDTTAAYLTSISKRYQYRDSKNILARFVDIETGACLECGLVHGFSNIDEAQQRQNKSNKNLAKLFWEAAV